MLPSSLLSIEFILKLLCRSHADYLEKGMVRFMIADGREGLPQEGPFDIILVGGGIATHG